MVILGCKHSLTLLLGWVLLAGMSRVSLQAAQPGPVRPEEDFSGWIFGKGVLDTEMSTKLARGRLVSVLRSWIVYLDQISGLTEEQQTKLRLAGLGDIEHFLDRVEEKKRVFQTIRHEPQRVPEFLKEIRPLQEVWISNPFLEGSLFWKTLRKTLPQDQLAALERRLQELEQSEMRELIRRFVDHERSRLSLNDSQCTRLEQLLLKDVPRSKRLAGFRYCGLLQQVAQIPETRIRGIFQEPQWVDLKKELDWAKQAPPSLSDFDFYRFEQRQVARQQAAKPAR